MRFLFTCATLILIFPAAFAQTVDVKAVVPSTAIAIDGVVSDEEWGGIPSLKGGFDEADGTPEPHPTQYWFAYDAKYVYFAAKASDPNPSAIKAQEYRSNVALSGDDYVGIFIDPFGKLDGDNQFEINARGATNLRIAGGRAAKREWLGEILAKGRITAEGYEIEARIPWAIMRLPAAGVRDMRIGAYRVIPRTGRAYLVTDISGNKVEQIPYWRGVNSPDIKAERVVKLLPYMYLGFDEREGAVFNTGIDLKTQLMGLDLVGSVNPDFRNIENEVLSLDFSYFERLAGESRPFFLEGQDFFRTSMDAPLFTSQQIDRFDMGVKAFGKIGDRTTIATLDTLEIGKRNDFVGIVRHSFDERSGMTAGVAHQAMTDDPELGNNSNLASYLSFFKGFGAFDAFGHYMSSSDGVLGAGHRANGGVSYSGKSVGGYLEYVEMSADFKPRLGFAPETDFKGIAGSIGYNRQVKTGPLMDYGIDFDFQEYDRMSTGDHYRSQQSVGVDFGMRNNVGIGLGWFQRNFRGFNDRLASMYLAVPRNDPYRRWAIEADMGNIAGHGYSSVSAGVRVRPMKNFQVSASAQWLQHFEEATQMIVSGNYDINAFDSISGRVIHRDGDINGYLAYRRTGSRGAEYFLILGDPNARQFRASIIAKAVFPIDFKF